MFSNLNIVNDTKLYFYIIKVIKYIAFDFKHELKDYLNLFSDIT